MYVVLLSPAILPFIYSDRLFSFFIYYCYRCFLCFMPLYFFTQFTLAANNSIFLLLASLIISATAWSFIWLQRKYQPHWLFTWFDDSPAIELYFERLPSLDAWHISAATTRSLAMLKFILAETYELMRIFDESMLDKMPTKLPQMADTIGLMAKWTISFHALTLPALSIIDLHSDGLPPKGPTRLRKNYILLLL